MRPAARLLVTVLVALGVGYALFASWRSRGDAAEARLERARLKRELLERGMASRQLGPDRSGEWPGEARSLLRWYFDELAALRARHPGEAARGPERPRRADGQRDAAAQAEWRRYAEERFALLRDGRYEPVLSTGENGLRLDLLALEPAPNPATGERGIRLEFALWGAPRRVDREAQAGTSRTTTRVVVPVAFRRMEVKLLDARGKLYGEMSGGGEPYQKLADPERFVEDFPPGILFGTWYLDLLPREAVRAEMTIALEERGAAGSEVTATCRFDLPVREDWKLAAGQVFQAQTREAPR